MKRTRTKRTRTDGTKQHKTKPARAKSSSTAARRPRRASGENNARSDAALTPSERVELERLRAGAVMRLDKGRSWHLEQLKAFYWTAKLGSFSAAAEYLNTTYQAVMQRVHKLEAQLEFKLFEPIAGKQGILTPKGRRMKAHFKRIIAAHEHADAEFQNRGPELVPLRLGVIQAVAHSFLPSLLKQLRAAHAGIVLESTVLASNELAALLWDDAVDLTISALETHGDAFDSAQMPAMAWVFVGDGSVYAKSTHDFAEIVQRGLICFQANTPIHRNCARLIKKHCKEVVRMHTVTSITGMMGLLLAGYGVATLPEPVARRVTEQYPHLRIIKTHEKLEPLPVVLSWRHELNHPHHAPIIELVRSEVRKALAP